jgi:hypothetical protein
MLRVQVPLKRVSGRVNFEYVKIDASTLYIFDEVMIAI